MTTLDELEALAKAADKEGRAVEQHLGYSGSRSGSYAALVRNDALLALIELCKQQHEALRLVHTAMPTTLACDDFHHSKKDQHDCETTCPVTARYYYAESMADEALAAFENFGVEK